MLRAFNSFQAVAAFVGMPFLISWLSSAEFPGAGVAFFSACALYVVSFGFMIVAVSVSFDKYS